MTEISIQSPAVCARTDKKSENTSLASLFPGRGSSQVPAELKSTAGASTLFFFFYEGWNFNFGNAAVTFDTAHLQSSYFHRPSMYYPTLCRTRSQR